MDPTSLSTAADLCASEVNRDLYGYGIRIGLYLQWAATGLTYLIRGEGKFRRDIWLALVFFITGMAGYLVYRSVRHHSVRPVDTYITMTLCFGVCYSGVPRLVWRATCTWKRTTFWCRSLPREIGYWTEQLEYTFLFSLFLAGLGFQLWFWIVDSALSLPSDCTNVGFLFVAMHLSSRPLRIVNLAFLVILSILCMGSLGYFLHVALDGKNRLKRVKNTEKQRELHDHEMESQDRSFFRKEQFANCAFELCTMAFVIWAVESTIIANFGRDLHIGEASQPTIDAGQTIAITMGIFSVLRVFFVFYGTFARWISDFSDTKTQEHRMSLLVAHNNSNGSMPVEHLPAPWPSRPGTPVGGTVGPAGGATGGGRGQGASAAELPAVVPGAGRMQPPLDGFHTAPPTPSLVYGRYQQFQPDQQHQQNLQIPDLRHHQPQHHQMQHHEWQQQQQRHNFRLENHQPYRHQPNYYQQHQYLRDPYQDQQRGPTTVLHLTFKLLGDIIRHHVFRQR